MRSYYIRCDFCNNRLVLGNTDEEKNWSFIETNDIHTYDRKDICPECLERLNNATDD